MPFKPLFIKNYPKGHSAIFDGKRKKDFYFLLSFLFLPSAFYIYVFRLSERSEDRIKTIKY